MRYFLTVETTDGTLICAAKEFASMEAALRVISDEYLEDDPAYYRWNGYFAMRDGALTRFYMTQGTSAPLLRKDIARIDVVSERGLLERETFARPADD